MFTKKEHSQMTHEPGVRVPAFRAESHDGAEAFRPGVEKQMDSLFLNVTAEKQSFAAKSETKKGAPTLKEQEKKKALQSLKRILFGVVAAALVAATVTGLFFKDALIAFASTFVVKFLLVFGGLFVGAAIFAFAVSILVNWYDRSVNDPKKAKQANDRARREENKSR